MQDAATQWEDLEGTLDEENAVSVTAASDPADGMALVSSLGARGPGACSRLPGVASDCPGVGCS